MNSVLEAHDAFWQTRNLDAPILGLEYALDRYMKSLMNLSLADGAVPFEGMLLKPEQVNPENLYPTEQFPLRRGELFETIQPGNRIPGMEAIVGCPIQVSLTAHTFWARQIWGDDWYKKKIIIPFDEIWFQKFLEVTRWCIINFYPRYLMASPPMSGPLDMLAAMMGVRNVALSMRRHPEEVHKALEQLAEIYVRVSRAQQELFPKFRGGNCTKEGLWTPGSVVRIQEDSMASLSPALYEEFVLPIDEKIASNFDYAYMDFHSRPFLDRGLTLAELVRKMRGIAAVSITTDPPPFGPQLVDLLPLLSTVHEKKGLIIKPCMYEYFVSALPPAAIDALGPAGLCITNLVIQHSY